MGLPFFGNELPAADLHARRCGRSLAAIGDCPDLFNILSGASPTIRLATAVRPTIPTRHTHIHRDSRQVETQTPDHSLREPSLPTGRLAQVAAALRQRQAIEPENATG